MVFALAGDSTITSDLPETFPLSGTAPSPSPDERLGAAVRRVPFAVTRVAGAFLFVFDSGATALADARFRIPVRAAVLDFVVVFFAMV
jgi:hypothetical protein